MEVIVKRLLVIMLIIVAVGVVSAATITVHADVPITLSYRVSSSNAPFEEVDGNIINVDIVWPTFYQIKIEWLNAVLPRPHIVEERTYAEVWRNTDDIHLYYQFIETGTPPTAPITK